MLLIWLIYIFRNVNAFFANRIEMDRAHLDWQLCLLLFVKLEHVFTIQALLFSQLGLTTTEACILQFIGLLAGHTKSDVSMGVDWTENIFQQDKPRG